MYVPSRFNFLDDSLLEDYRKTSIMNTDIIEKENGLLDLDNLLAKITKAENLLELLCENS